MLKNTITATLIAALPFQAVATECSVDAMVVFDGSASMSSNTFFVGETTRIQDARMAMEVVMPEIEQFRRVGLMIYGPGGPDSCSGIDLRFSPRANAARPVIDAVNGLEPSGLTPLSESVLAAAQALNSQADRGVVVLVTDGDETCGGSPCSVAQTIMAEAPNMVVHVIGYRVFTDTADGTLDPVKEDELQVIQARCLADQTGGIYTVTRDVDGLIMALRDTLGCAIVSELPAARRQG